MSEHDEEKAAAKALSDILESCLFRAHDERRTWLYCWERDGLQWLLRYRRRRPDGATGTWWMRDFLDLNEDAINSEDGRMDFNLRAFDEHRALRGDAG